MKKLLLIGICFMLKLISLSCFANGGGVYAISSVERSSNPMFLEIKNISIISEKLYIKLDENRSNVKVIYLLWNNSDNDYQNIDYGFPIDYIFLSDSSSFSWRDSYLKDVRFKLNGKELAFQSSKATPLANQDDKNDLYRRWFYTQLDITKHSFITLEVEYSLENNYLCDGSSPLYLSVLDGCTMHTLTYDFSPASNWGDGIIKDFYVEIDASDLDLKGNFSQEATENFEERGVEVEGLNLHASDNRYTFRQKNFDLNKAEPLFIKYFSQAISSLDIIANHRLNNDAYQVKTSGELKKYPSSNLTDMNLETAWVTKGKGGWIEFTFKEPVTNLAGFAIVNGFAKNYDTYNENNRLKNIRVDIKQTGKDWKTMEWFSELPDKPYSKLYFSNLFTKIDYIDFYDSIESEEPIEKIRFRIQDIYSGSKYDDTCISEIILLKQ